jgi:ATP-dependent Clp protease adaptor protein ClpS
MPGGGTVANSFVLPIYGAVRERKILHYTAVPLCGMLVSDWTSKACHPMTTATDISGTPACGTPASGTALAGTHLVADAWSQPARIAPHAADDDRKRNANKEPGGPGTAVITKTKTQTKKPSLYRVLLLNDDYTPMEFVVHVLERFFNKDREAATRIMLHVHHHGIGECGIYTYEVAETKVTQVMDFARKHQHPLQCVMEKK